MARSDRKSIEAPSGTFLRVILPSVGSLQVERPFSFLCLPFASWRFNSSRGDSGPSSWLPRSGRETDTSLGAGPRTQRSGNQVPRLACLAAEQSRRLGVGDDFFPRGIPRQLA